jgi:hypothetical protein
MEEVFRALGDEIAGVLRVSAGKARKHVQEGILRILNPPWNYNVEISTEVVVSHCSFTYYCHLKSLGRWYRIVHEGGPCVGAGQLLTKGHSDLVLLVLNQYLWRSNSSEAQKDLRPGYHGVHVTVNGRGECVVPRDCLSFEGIMDHMKRALG